MTATPMTATATDLKQTPLHGNHLALGAKMSPFGGWDMPLQYSKVKEEHLAVREAAGLFDVSHMGVFTLSAQSSEDVAAFLDGMVPNDVAALDVGKALYTQLLNEQGGILDDLIIYRTGFSDLPELFTGFEQWFVICNAGNAEADFDWLSQHCPEGVTLTNESEKTALVALQGPKFLELLSACGLTTSQLPQRFALAPVKLAGISTIVCRTGYTGEDGVEILMCADDAPMFWDALLTEGKELGVLPCGLAARDTLRLEAAYPLHGNDITVQTTPLEAGLGWSVKLNNPVDFIGKTALAEQKREGVSRKFICLQIEGKGIARAHTPICLSDGTVIGEVTSGTLTPSLPQPIAMGYVNAERAGAVGDMFSVEIRGKHVPAKRVARPFYKSSAL